VSAMPRFGLRSLLILFAFAAVALTALARPSVYWSIPLPAVALILFVWGVSRAVSIPAERVFWLSFMAGLLSYGVTFVALRVLFFIHHGRYEFWSEYFFDDILWHKFHDPIDTSTIINEYTELDFTSFIIWLNITVAVMLSAVAAYVVQFLFRVKNQRC
jgi:hypothetical protein